MRILYTGIRGLPPTYGGFERHIDQISRYIASVYNYDISVVCEIPINLNKNPINYLGVKLLYYPLIPGPRWLSETIFDLYSFIRGSLIKDLDLIYYCGLSSGFSSFIPRIFGKKIIVNVDGFEWKNKKFNPILRTLLYFNVLCLLVFPNALITDNTSVYEYYKNKFKKNTYLIPYSVNIPEEPTPEKVEEILFKYRLNKRKYILMVTRIEKMNSVEYVIIESEKIFNKFGISLVIAGDTSTDYAKHLTQKYGKREHVHFLGFIFNSTELTVLRKNASIYVHGQVTGGTSPALLEAMAAGMVIASFECDSNCNTMKNTNYYFSYDYDYYLKNGVYKECINQNSTKSLYETISHILFESNETLKKIATQNINIVMSEYGLDSIAKMHVKLYNEICNKR